MPIPRKASAEEQPERSSLRAGRVGAEEESGARRQLLQTPTSSPTSAPTSTSNHPFCIKTGGATLVASQANICSAVPLISTAFSQMIAGKSQVYLADLYGGAVRLAFHDAGEVDLTATDTAGPDGCLSTEADNNGLLESTSVVTSILEPMWQTYCDKISRADFWALMGKLAVEAAEPTRTISIPFYYGRKDNTACDAGHGRLPGSEFTVADTSKVFVTRMGLTMTDAVTLLGAHTLGHVHTQFSGYGFPGATTTTAANILTNAWDNTPAVFDNIYFSDTINLQWSSGFPVDAAHAVWNRGPNAVGGASGEVCLTAEMALAFPTFLNGVVPDKYDCGPTTPNPADGYGCGLAGVPPFDRVKPTTYAVFEKYSQPTTGNANFLMDFSVAYNKMVNVGYNYGTVTGQKLGDLNYYGSCPAAPTATPTAQPTAAPTASTTTTATIATTGTATVAGTARASPPPPPTTTTPPRKGGNQ